MRIFLPLLTLFVLYLSPFCLAEENREAAHLRYKKADAVLNKTYKEVLSKIESFRTKSYKQSQRDWIGYRDYMAEYQVGLVDNKKKKEESVSYWSMMADLTEARSIYLQHWLGVKSKNGWDGDYVDGRGGHLSISKVDGKIEFSITVVRGPTYHTGSLSGLAQVNSFMARYSDKKEAEEDEAAWLTFIQEGQLQIKVIGANTGQHHGARAYFDGVYIRAKSTPTPPTEP